LKPATNKAATRRLVELQSANLSSILNKRPTDHGKVRAPKYYMLIGAQIKALSVHARNFNYGCGISLKRVDLPLL
jgi:hypothetical protein